MLKCSQYKHVKALTRHINLDKCYWETLKAEYKSAWLIEHILQASVPAFEELSGPAVGSAVKACNIAFEVIDEIFFDNTLQVKSFVRAFPMFVQKPPMQ